MRPSPPRAGGEGLLLLVDKSADRTSRAPVNDLVRALGRRDIGHAGTLDPFATGLLLLLVGRATRLVPWIHEWDKEYETTLVLGVGTDTLDRTGTVTARAEVGPDVARRLPGLLASLEGEIEQAPPMVSAVRVGGRRLHELARQGITVERTPRLRTVHALELLGVNGPRVSLRVVCSSGTYVRSLAEEIGRRLDLPAHVDRLRRTRIGSCRVEDAIEDGRLRAAGAAELLELARPMAGILDWPIWPATPADLAEMRHGRMPASGPPAGGGPGLARWRVLDGAGGLAALVEAPPGAPPRFLRVFIAGDE